MMKKSLIALAVAGTFAAPAFANVTVSGAMRLDVQNVSGIANAADKGIHVNNNNSVITVSGSEDIGGGMKAGFSLTAGIPLTSTATASVSRQNQFLSLSGGFGTVRLGVHDSLSTVAGRSVDLFANQSAGDARALTNVGTAEARGNDVIAYISPSFNGVTVALAHANMDADNTGSNTGKINMAKLSYANGPLSLAAVHQTRDYTTDEKDLRVVGSYTMGDTRLVALYDKVDNQLGTPADDSKTWGVGVAHNMGPITLKAQHYNYALANSDNDATMTAVGADYNLSKRTKLMAAYGVVTNKGAATKGTAANVTGADSLVVAGGEDPKRFSIGVQHSF